MLTVKLKPATSFILRQEFPPPPRLIRRTITVPGDRRPCKGVPAWLKTQITSSAGTPNLIHGLPHIDRPRGRHMDTGLVGSARGRRHSHHRA